MLILSIKSFVLSNKEKSYKFPLPSYFYDGILILKVITNNDIESIIEISPYAVDIKKLKKIFDDKIIPLLESKKINSLLKIRENITYQKFGSVLASVIQASISQMYFDIISKFSKKPISHILNKKLKTHKKQVKFYASGGMIFDYQGYDRLIDEAVQAKENGFYGWKFRPKTPSNNPSHAERKKNPPDFDHKLIILFINKLKKTVGEDFKIMIDFGQRIKNLNTSMNLLSCLEDNNIFFIEEPFKYSIKNYKELNKKINLNIAGCESFTKTSDYDRWVRNSLINFIQPDTNLVSIDKVYNYSKANNFKNIIMHNWCLPMNMIFNISLHHALELNNIFEYNITFNPMRDMIFEENFQMTNNIPTIKNLNLNIKISDNLIKRFDITDKL